MNITTDKMIIEMTGQEARDLSYHILHSLKQSIDDHYSKVFHDSYKRGYEGHAKPLLYEQKGNDIRMMRNLMFASGSDYNLEEDLINYFEKQYIKANGSLELKG